MDMGRHLINKEDLFQEERFFYATAVTGRWQLSGRVSTFETFLPVKLFENPSSLGRNELVRCEVATSE